MPTLAGINGASLVPNLGQQIGQGVNVAQGLQGVQMNAESLRQAEAQGATDAAYNQLLNEYLSGGQQAAPVQQGLAGGQSQPVPVQAAQAQTLAGGVAQAAQEPQQARSQQQVMAELVARFPDRFEPVLEQMGIVSDRQKSEAADFAFKLRNTPFLEREPLIAEREQRLLQEGRNPADTLSLRDMSEAEQNTALDVVQMTALTPKERLEIAQKGDAALSKSIQVQSSDILPDGTTVQSLKGGGVAVYAADGTKLEGAQAAEKIKEAQTYGAEIQGARSTARTSGSLDAQLEKKPELAERVERAEANAKSATGKVEEYYDNIQNIESNIALYDQAIDALDQGANTGAVSRFLPSVKTASVKLKNIQANLGLNVIQNTTFGALSESELAFALDTTIPEGMNEADLKVWLQEKKTAQQKLSDYYDGAIQFLSVPGNTLADLRATNPKDTEKAADESPSSGGFKILSVE